ncbi:MAG TPA: alpha/beta fold hydrolase, partial [Opitutaceae bacterium]
PVTETQRALARIWQEVLKRPRVGINDNFFEIGGRSLLAARIFSMIEGRFGKKLALATLFRSPTVELLARIVDGEPAEPARCRLVVLQAEGGLTPLFCMPGAGSDAIAFHSLSKRLGTDRPVYGLQAAGLDTTEEPDSGLSVESVCAQFVDAIRTAQPRGPYLLAGHCFGGLLAYEVAQQLSAAGEKVALLALIDTIVSDTFPTSFRVSLSDKLAHHRQQLAGRALAEKCSYVIRKLAEFKEAGESRKRLNQSFGRVEDMHRRYTLSPYKGQLTLFMAADSFLNRFPERDPRQTWMRMGSESPHVMVVAGDHASLLKEPNVGDLAHQLRGCLSGSPARTLNACTP